MILREAARAVVESAIRDGRPDNELLRVLDAASRAPPERGEEWRAGVEEAAKWLRVNANGRYDQGSGWEIAQEMLSTLSPPEEPRAANPEPTIVLTPDEFAKLDEYSCTLPTGTTVGKRWKCRRPYRNEEGDHTPPTWWMGEYVEDDATRKMQGFVAIKWFRIVAVKWNPLEKKP